MLAMLVSGGEVRGQDREGLKSTTVVLNEKVFGIKRRQTQG